MGNVPQPCSSSYECPKVCDKELKPVERVARPPGDLQGVQKKCTLAHVVVPHHARTRSRSVPALQWSDLGLSGRSSQRRSSRETPVPLVRGEDCCGPECAGVASICCDKVVKKTQDRDFALAPSVPVLKSRTASDDVGVHANNLTGGVLDSPALGELLAFGGASLGQQVAADVASPARDNAALQGSTSESQALQEVKNPQIEREEMFLVHDIKLRSGARGVQYRCSPSMDDRAANMAPFGTVVLGTVHADEWLKVSDSEFLPLSVHGHQVLTALVLDEMHYRAPGVQETMGEMCLAKSPEGLWRVAKVVGSNKDGTFNLVDDSNGSVFTGVQLSDVLPLCDRFSVPGWEFESDASRTRDRET